MIHQPNNQIDMSRKEAIQFYRKKNREEEDIAGRCYVVFYREKKKGFIAMREKVVTGKDKKRGDTSPPRKGG